MCIYVWMYIFVCICVLQTEFLSKRQHVSATVFDDSESSVSGRHRVCPVMITDRFQSGNRSHSAETKTFSVVVVWYF